jgi:hypothetical protein
VKKRNSKRLSGDSRQLLPCNIPRCRTPRTNSKIVVFRSEVAIHIDEDAKALTWIQSDLTEGREDENGLHA